MLKFELQWTLDSFGFDCTFVHCSIFEEGSWCKRLKKEEIFGIFFKETINATDLK